MLTNRPPRPDRPLICPAWKMVDSMPRNLLIASESPELQGVYCWLVASILSITLQGRSINLDDERSARRLESKSGTNSSVTYCKYRRLTSSLEHLCVFPYYMSGTMTSSNPSQSPQTSGNKAPRDGRSLVACERCRRLKKKCKPEPGRARCERCKVTDQTCSYAPVSVDNGRQPSPSRSDQAGSGC